ncbi:nucleotidyltransferase domain-containing protein, partial [Myxococcota bacterium]|nr:nucleotidyltransferase domain-containing protein [Myxococcota bacterium]
MPKTPLFRLHRAALSVAEQLTLNPAVQAIAITGSVARGDTSPVSDIDLWILGNRNTRETFQHSRISVTLLWQTVDQALTDDTLLRFEVEDAFVLYDPDGLFRKVRALYWKRREELRAAMIRNTTKVIRDFISQAQQQSPEAAIALIREAGRRSAALRIYLDLGWRVPKWRHFNKYLRHQCFEKLRLLQNLTVDCSTW